MKIFHVCPPSMTFIYQDFHMLNNVKGENVKGVAYIFSDKNLSIIQDISLSSKR